MERDRRSGIECAGANALSHSSGRLLSPEDATGADAEPAVGTLGALGVPMIPRPQGRPIIDALSASRHEY